MLGNLFRMLTIIIAAELGGQSAGAYVHEGGPGGVLSLLPYVPVFLGLMVLEKWLREPKPPNSAAANGAEPPGGAEPAQVEVQSI